MITAHTLVKNEEKFIWYAINSILGFVDKIIIWDTGSSDKTVEIIRTIKSSKIVFEEKGIADSKRISSLRNEMLQQTTSDWVMILDGDEIWHRQTLEEVNGIIKVDNIDVIIHKTKMLVGDMYHYQDEMAGRYEIADRIGHYNLRFFRNTPNIKVTGEYPNEAFINENGIKLQEIDKNKIYFAKHFYLHASHLVRSSKDMKKIKYEIGEDVPLDYFYPESFFYERPKIVDNVWKNMSLSCKLRANIETPLKKLKRRIR